MYLIEITKLSEAEGWAEYSFSAAEAAVPGVLRLDKITGRITLIRSISGGEIGGLRLAEWRDPTRYFERAARKVELAWKDGHLPDSLTWAS
jgi:hypothetical protein